MRLLACSACLTGSLFLAGPAVAEKLGGLDPFQLEDDSRKSLMSAPSGTSPAGARLDRSDLARMMQSRSTLDGWNGRPYPGLEDPEPETEIHPLFRREYRPGGPLADLDWRERGSFEGLKNRYEALGNSVKSRIFGKNLADNVKVELDGSPEIELEFEFD